MKRPLVFTVSSICMPAALRTTSSRIDSLKKEQGDVETEFDALIARELPALNKSLAKQKLPPVVPIGRKNWDAANSDDNTAATAKSTAEHTSEAFFGRN